MSYRYDHFRRACLMYGAMNRGDVFKIDDPHYWDSTESIGENVNGILMLESVKGTTYTFRLLVSRSKFMQALNMLDM